MEDWCSISWKTDFWFREWHKEQGKFSPELLKNLRIGTLMGPFIHCRKCMSLKFTRKFRVMTAKNDAKFEEELTCLFKIDTKIWHILTQPLDCLKNLHFIRLLLTKECNI